jgi:hypothetical protein
MKGNRMENKRYPKEAWQTIHIRNLEQTEKLGK